MSKSNEQLEKELKQKEKELKKKELELQEKEEEHRRKVVLATTINMMNLNNIINQ